jgi:hypothetical protein
MLSAQLLFILVPGLLLVIVGVSGMKFPGLTNEPTRLFRSILTTLGVVIIVVGLFWR